MDHQQAALQSLDEALAHVDEFAGPDDVARLQQFHSHLATSRMVVEELHGVPSQAPVDQEL